VAVTRQGTGMQKSILIVDDHSRVRRILRDFFENYGAGLAVHEAADGVEALEKVVLDLSMPRLNGLQAAKRIRAMNVRAPIIMFTMHAAEIPATAITSSQLDAVVMKPDLDSLHQQVEFFLNR